VGQADGRRARGVLGLVLGHPAGLGRGERRDRDGPDRVGPGPRSAELGDQRGRLGRGPVVVPEQRGAYDVAVVVEGDVAVLLGADGQSVDVVETAGRGRRFLQRPLPCVRVHLRAGRVRRLPAAYE
jgi:hypothetical protein